MKYIYILYIRNGLGGRLKVLVSGGSSLPLSVETFFELIGLSYEPLN